MEPSSRDMIRLGHAVKERRLQLNLTIKRASEDAQVSFGTWRRVEGGEAVRWLSYARIEEFLGWATGSCRELLEGGQSTLRDADPEPPWAATSPSAEDLSQAITTALVAVADNLTAAEIREVSRLAVEELQRRGLT